MPSSIHTGYSRNVVAAEALPYTRNFPAYAPPCEVHTRGVLQTFLQKTPRHEACYSPSNGCALGAVRHATQITSYSRRKPVTTRSCGKAVGGGGSGKCVQSISKMAHTHDTPHGRDPWGCHLRADDQHCQSPDDRARYAGKLLAPGRQ
jgi:hypothetical protein